MASYAHAAVTDHCKNQLKERNLEPEQLKIVLSAPDEVLASGEERIILQKLVVTEGKSYLWRVVIAMDSNPPRVITAYRTSKLKKYLKEQ